MSIGKQKNEYPLEWDGIYFMPSEKGKKYLKFVFFDLEGDLKRGNPINTTEIGECFHIAYFEEGKCGQPIFKYHVDVILVDPITYLKGLIGSKLYGCVVRKTETSVEWFENYMKNIKQNYGEVETGECYE